jgi:hypothetical protein
MRACNCDRTESQIFRGRGEKKKLNFKFSEAPLSASAKRVNTELLERKSVCTLLLTSSGFASGFEDLEDLGSCGWQILMFFTL